MIGGQNRGDPRVRKALESLEYKHSMTADGDFKCVFTLDDDRSQAVTINSNTSKYGTVEIRRVWSIAYAGSWPSEKLANYLLRDNAQTKFGSWCLMLAGDDDVAIVFAADIAAEIDAETLDDVLQMVYEKADELEEKLGGDDDY